MFVPNNLRIGFAIPEPAKNSEEVAAASPLCKEPYIESFYTDYLMPLRTDKEKIPTILNPDRLIPLYDFYVRPILRKRDTKEGLRYKKDAAELGDCMYDVTPDKLRAFSNRVLITGDGGMGKSSLMLDLLIQSIDTFKTTGILPIYADLRYYSSEYDSLVTFLAENSGSWWDYSAQVLKNHIERYSTTIYLDGFDEISSYDNRHKFADQLNQFIRKYRKAQIIVSSRLFMDAVPLLRLPSLEIQQLTLEQAKELIDKAIYRPDRPEIKQRFKKELETDYFINQPHLVGNPLLLTMMLRVYGNIGFVPNTLAQFYEKAYYTLAQDHDAVKGYKRLFYTGLTPESLKAVIEEFCVHAYYRGVRSFGRRKASDYLYGLDAYSRYHINGPIDEELFIKDLKENLCIIYEDKSLTGLSGKEETEYSFVGNQYFYDYFVASHVHNKMIEKSEDAIELFDNHRYSRSGDHVFEMLYEMGEDLVCKYLFLPKLASVFRTVDTKTESSPFHALSDDQMRCLVYLQTCYEAIYYSSDESEYTDVSLPISPILEFLLNLEGFHTEIKADEVNNPENQFTTEIHYRIWDEDEGERIVASDELVLKEEYSSDFLVERNTEDVLYAFEGGQKLHGVIL